METIGIHSLDQVGCFSRELFLLANFEPLVGFRIESESLDVYRHEA